MKNENVEISLNDLSGNSLYEHNGFSTSGNAAGGPQDEIQIISKMMFGFNAPASYIKEFLIRKQLKSGMARVASIAKCDFSRRSTVARAHSTSYARSTVGQRLCGTSINWSHYRCDKHSAPSRTPF